MKVINRWKFTNLPEGKAKDRLLEMASDNVGDYHWDSKKQRYVDGPLSEKETIKWLNDQLRLITLPGTCSMHELSGLDGSDLIGDIKLLVELVQNLNVGYVVIFNTNLGPLNIKGIKGIKKIFEYNGSGDNVWTYAIDSDGESFQ